MAKNKELQMKHWTIKILKALLDRCLRIEYPDIEPEDEAHLGRS